MTPSVTESNMKMSLVDFRKVWWELIDFCQPTELPAKPTKSQQVNENTELRYGRTNRRTGKTDGSNPHGE